MSEQEAFERIVAALNGAAFDETRWGTAFALIDEALATHGSTLVFTDGAFPEDVRSHTFSTWMRGQRHREIERVYLETYHPIDERVPRVRLLPDSKLTHISDVYTEEELKTSAAYNAARSFGHGGNGIHVRLAGPSGGNIHWFVHDPVHGGDWSSAPLDSIRRLLPHIRQTMCFQQALAGADALGATLTGLLETTGLGVIQIDARGRILAANDRAADLLRLGDGLCDKGGFLAADTPQEDAKLQDLLNRVLPRFGAPGVGCSMSVRRRGVPLPLVLHVNPVRGRDTVHPAWPAAALVLVVDPARGTRVDPAAIAAALDLTTMESRVAARLADGMSVRDIAAAMGRQQSTIRSHIKHIFTKHGLSRQVDLVRLVWLVQPLAGTACHSSEHQASPTSRLQVDATRLKRRSD